MSARRFSEADERFRFAGQEFAGFTAKEALDKANADGTVIARMAPTTPSR